MRAEISRNYAIIVRYSLQIAVSLSVVMIVYRP